VAGDSIDGVGEIELGLRRAGKGYGLGGNATRPFPSWGDKPPLAGTAEAIARGLDDTAWQRLSAGGGTMIGAADHRSRKGAGASAREGASGATAGPIASWPTSRRPTSRPPGPGRGRAAF
jgi:hypothetical protein